MTGIGQTLVGIIILAIFANFLNKPVRRLLKKLVRSKLIRGAALRLLVYLAEHKKVFKYRGAGPAKKEWVKVSYSKMLDEADEAIDSTIDCIVSAVNLKSGSLKNETTQAVEDLVDTTTDKALGRYDKEE